MRSLYLRLALDNIRKGRRLYVPYALTGCSMVTVVYLLAVLANDPGLLAMPGSPAVSALLAMGIIVMGVFSTIFLFYTNSFLMKRRGKELGLYNVLGMNKRHILRVVFWETLLCAVAAIVSGLLLGVLLSKLAALALVRFMGGAPTSEFYIAWNWMAITAAGFGGVYFLIFLRSAINVLRVRPLELMRQTQAGERPPRGNVLLAFASVALLLSGYALALRVKSPLEAFSLFFIAVLLVILGTYGSFRSASVYILSLLRRNKRYYYHADHFISVSGMSYRMKRNGDSLATICILLTMVLVMMCSTTCMHFGTEDSLLRSYPFEIRLHSDSDGVPAQGELAAACEKTLARIGITPTASLAYRSLSCLGLFEGEDNSRIVSANDAAYSSTCALTVIPLTDYNAMMGTDLSLAPDELALYSTADIPADTLTLFDEMTYRIAQRDVPLPPDASADGFGFLVSTMLILPDESVLPRLAELSQYGKSRSRIQTYYMLDTGLSDAAQLDTADALYQALVEAGFENLSSTTRVANRPSMRALNVGFLFLGILLSLAFLCATALSMYYKQITEGLEDQARYDIMRRVGLSRTMIRRSINSQLLIMFFSPLLVSGVHLAFAFPMLTLLLQVLGLFNPALMAMTTLCTFGALAALYAAMYAVTSRVYYRIVAGLASES